MDEENVCSRRNQNREGNEISLLSIMWLEETSYKLYIHLLLRMKWDTFGGWTKEKDDVI